MASRSDHTSVPPNLQGATDNPSAWILKRIWKRVNRQNEHFMGAIVGREGSGKSHTAIRIADELDPTFNAERVIFDVIDLLKTLRDGDHEKGQAYVLDEAGVQLGNRTWQERSQILANQALQIIRDENLILLFTLPMREELDSQADNRLQALYEIVQKEHNEYVRGRWFWLDPNRVNRQGTTYTKNPKRRVNGSVQKYKTLAFRPPRQELIEPYEERKQAFQDQFYEKVIAEHEDDEAEDDPDEMGVKDVAKRILADDNLEEVTSTHGNTGEPYVNADLIRAEYELSHSDARTVKSLVEKQLED